MKCRESLTLYTWYKEKVPENLLIKQVYGIVFSETGKVILRVDDNKYKLTGGKPEKKDKNLEETLKREYLEELNVEIEDVHYLGYLLVEENKEPYAQVRMIARIKRIGSASVDVDTGRIYKRFMVTQENIKKYLNYSDDAGNEMLDDAIRFANKVFDFTSLDDKDYFLE